MPNSLRASTLEAYLEQLASSEPAPGGGAVVALLGAQASALLAMTLRVTGEAAKGLQSGQHATILRHLDEKRQLFMQLAGDDAAAFAAVMAAYRLPKADDGQKQVRSEAVQDAFKQATRVPLQVMAEMAALLDVAEAVSATAKASVASDTGIALQLLVAGLQASRYNLWINLTYLNDQAFKSESKKAARRHLSGVKERRKSLHQRLKALIHS